MKLTVNVEMLKENLKRVPDESERLADPLSGVTDVTDGVRYLYQKVLLPLMAGLEVRSDKLDMDQFEQDDIQTIAEFYENNYGAYSGKLKKLRSFYSVVAQSEPKCALVSYV